LTHFLFGGVMARAGLNRTSALATATLVLAAEAADLDVVTELGGHASAFEHHRGITHTFVGVPGVAAVVVLVLYLWYRGWGRRRWQPGRPPPRWGVLFALACLAGLSHILLDFTNNYGVRPFEPFSCRWYAWDIVFIVEPVLWIILLGGLLLPSLFGPARGEAASQLQGGRPRGRASALAALLLVCAFWGFRDHQHRRALAALEAGAYGGEKPVRVSAYPYYVNPFRWHGVVETRDFYDSKTVNSRLAQVGAGDGAWLRPKPEQTAPVLAAERSQVGRAYLSWAQYPIIETGRMGQPAPGYLVRFYDVRFLYPEFRGRRTLGAWVQLNSQLDVTAQDFGMHDDPAQPKDH
jgi:inner membrane protein